MSKRLQVLLDDAEFRRLRRRARRRGTTVAALVRDALRTLDGEAAVGNLEKKLAAIRAAVRHQFPAGDIEEMLAEIERGRGSLPE